MKILKLFILLLVTTSTLYMYLSAQSSTTSKETKEVNSLIVTNSSDTLISLAKSKLGSPYVYAKTGLIVLIVLDLYIISLLIILKVNSTLFQKKQSK